VTGTPVCVFAKPPVPGKVKTRLAQVIGAPAAAELASAMLQDIWAVVSSCAGVIPILAAAEEGRWPIDVQPANLWLQSGDDLGARMEGILRRALLDFPSAIALGADSPLLCPLHIQQALTKLENCDTVLGPSPDGGFYLLGIQRCPQGLFDDLPWSSPATLARTVERLQSHRMDVCRLAPLGDIDTPEDLRLLRQELQSGPRHVAPTTRRWLEMRNGQ
jgi:rSAM/selenodomain-associated transferase 1